MADYWMMYALLHGAVLEALEQMDDAAPERQILERAVKDVEKVYGQTRSRGEEDGISKEA